MTLPNLPYKGNQIPNQPFHSPEVPATFDRLFGARVANEQLDPNPSNAVVSETWTRPADWLPIPEISRTEQKFVGLHPVTDSPDGTRVALQFEGDYTVDWGDGVIENYDSGERAERILQWGDYPANTLTSSGYRQALITVTPNGSDLTVMDLGVRYGGLESFVIPGLWLEIVASLPQAQSISLYRGEYLRQLQSVTIINAGFTESFDEFLLYNRSVKKVEIREAPAVIETTRMFEDCFALFDVSLPPNMPLLEDVRDMFEDCYSLVSLPIFDTSSLEDFTYLFDRCSSIRYTPNLNTSSGTNFNGTWYENCSLTSFPELNVSQGTNFIYTWSNCRSLTTFPLIDVSSGIDFIGTWSSCYGLTSFPPLNVSSGTSFEYAWGNCTSLTSFPELDVSQGTNFGGAWANCASLTFFPELDLSSGTNFAYAWQDCASLTFFPELDLSSGTDFDYAWANCTSLTAFSEIDVSSGTNFIGAWRDCGSLTTFPAGVFDDCPVQANNFSFQGTWFNCALSQTSVDNILVSLDASGITNNYVNLNGGTSSAPGAAGLAAKTSLQGRGWTVITN